MVLSASAAVGLAVLCRGYSAAVLALTLLYRINGAPKMRTVTEPTAAEIAERCAEIQSRWDEQERWKREHGLAWDRQPTTDRVETPVIPLADVHAAIH